MKSLSSFFSVIVKSNQAILEELLTPYIAKCNKLGIFYKYDLLDVTDQQ